MLCKYNTITGIVTYLRVLPIRPFVRLSVCVSVCLSVCPLYTARLTLNRKQKNTER